MLVSAKLHSCNESAEFDPDQVKSVEPYPGSCILHFNDGSRQEFGHRWSQTKTIKVSIRPQGKSKAWARSQSKMPSLQELIKLTGMAKASS